MMRANADSSILRTVIEVKPTSSSLYLDAVDELNEPLRRKELVPLTDPHCGFGLTANLKSPGSYNLSLSTSI